MLFVASITGMSTAQVQKDPCSEFDYSSPRDSCGLLGALPAPAGYQKPASGDRGGDFGARSAGSMIGGVSIVKPKQYGGITAYNMNTGDKSWWIPNGGMQKITSRDPLFAGVTLPDTDITVVHRSDGSGTTFLFTSYLAMKAPRWASEVGANDAVKWPTGLGGKGNDGVAAYVKQTPGAIGYVEYAFAKQNNDELWKFTTDSSNALTRVESGYRVAGYAFAWEGSGRIARTNITESLNPKPWIIGGKEVNPGPSERVIIADGVISQGSNMTDRTRNRYTKIDGGWKGHQAPHLNGSLPSGGNLLYLKHAIELSKLDQQLLETTSWK